MIGNGVSNTGSGALGGRIKERNTKATLGQTGLETRSGFAPNSVIGPINLFDFDYGERVGRQGQSQFSAF